MGGLGLSGLTLTELLCHEAQAGTTAKKENSLLILWMRGGSSQHETWDPRMNAPVEYRDEFRATSTSLSGIQVVDMLPQCVAIQDKWSIVRSLYHANAGHSAGDRLARHLFAHLGQWFLFLFDPSVEATSNCL